MAKEKKSVKEEVVVARSARNNKISTSSTAEYFSKNLQQVGFSSAIKAVLTTLKEAVDNSLDACEEAGVLPEISVKIEKIGTGSLKSSDKIRITVTDNGPGIEPEDVPKVFGEYLASSKFGRGRCSRGQQGIGISAATTWAQLTSATGAVVISKTKNMKKAFSCVVEVDIKHNKGTLKSKDMIDWDRPHGTSVEFSIDGRIQMNGEAGLINYLNGTALVNPHLTLHFSLPDTEKQTIERVSTDVPEIPEAVEPHPHTMKLGEFIAYSHIYGNIKVHTWLKKGFSRVHEGVINDLVKSGFSQALLNKSVDTLGQENFKILFSKIQNLPLMAPSTKSVISIGEAALAKSIQRLGKIDFFSVVTRKPTICDFKPVQIEVAVARLDDNKSVDSEDSVQVLRFANRVPLQFDKSACAIVNAIQTVNWRAYGLNQPKDALPRGPYIIAVSVVSPFIKFKNASKETIDGSEELVEEIRRTLIQAGQRLSKHIRRENKENELEEKLRHIEQFCPILIEGLCRITSASKERKAKAEEGLVKILGRDARSTEQDLAAAHAALETHQEKMRHSLGENEDIVDMEELREEVEDEIDDESEDEKPSKAKTSKTKTKTKAKAKTKTKKVAPKAASKGKKTPKAAAKRGKK